MAIKRDKDKNTFGSELERLLLLTELKNSTVSEALNYDVSYISKWTTGKAIPSAKNIDKICSVVGELAVKQGSDEGVSALLSLYGVENRTVLAEAVKETLMGAYAEATGRFNESKYMNNSVFKAAPKGMYPLLADYEELIDKTQPVEIAVMADIFAMDHESKLKMAGIQDHRFVIKDKNDKIKLNYVIDLNSLDGESVYDVLLLTHMMANYSRTDFRLYYSDLAAGKLMISVKEKFAGISLLGRNKQFMCTTSTRDRAVVEDIYNGVHDGVEQDKVLFFATDMKSLLESYEYLQTLISQDTRWLIGHITEHFVSPELFAELKEQCFADNPQAAQEAERAYLVASNAIKNNQLRMMVYSSAFVDFALSGEVDFFNNKVVITPQQRTRELKHIRELLQSMDADHLKMMNGGFSDDFKYVTNPCMFLADSLDYLRLENLQYENNLMLIKDNRARQVFDVFFEKIWKYEHINMVSDHGEIINKLDSLIQTAELLAGADV